MHNALLIWIWILIPDRLAAKNNADELQVSNAESFLIDNFEENSDIGRLDQSISEKVSLHIPKRKPRVDLFQSSEETRDTSTIQMNFSSPRLLGVDFVEIIVEIIEHSHSNKIKGELVDLKKEYYPTIPEKDTVAKICEDLNACKDK